MKPLVVAFHLPQFHTIPENDQWWGPGYTEWRRVKAALPLFPNHNQPRFPQNNYYYNLLRIETHAWQQELARQHNIGAFCYYHYWFNGKQLLEKPLELILATPALSLPFCLAWANEPWTKNWDNNKGQLLVNQTYGDQQDWLHHIKRLTPFFQDPRYLRIDGHPVFIIYRSPSIPNLGEMLNTWNRYLHNNGLRKLRLLAMNTAYDIEKRSNTIEGTIDFEPMYTLRHHMSYAHYLHRKFRTLLFITGSRLTGQPPFIRRRVSYTEVWKRILRRPVQPNHILGAFIDWDNTPRKGGKGVVFDGATPSVFCHYFKKQYQRAMQANHPCIFINAWNEWSEGTYLEPDLRYGTGYLEAIRQTISDIN